VDRRFVACFFACDQPRSSTLPRMLANTSPTRGTSDRLGAARSAVSFTAAWPRVPDASTGGVVVRPVVVSSASFAGVGCAVAFEAQDAETNSPTQFWPV
jgi:hypothetical protein